MKMDTQDLQVAPHGLPIAQLETISFLKLSNSNAQEKQKLFDTCCNNGFFYLNMQGTAPHIQHLVNEIFVLEEKLFALPEEEKAQYDIDKLSSLKLNGYKPLGRNRGGLAGKKDGFESWALPRDVISEVVKVPFERPKLVDQYLESLRSFTEAASAAILAILGSLSSSLQLPPGETLQDFHRTDAPSPTMIRLLKYHKQPIMEHGDSHIAHTDLGSMTLLFTRQYGLQVMAPGSEEWAWVQPRAGHAVVNIGDGLSLLTNKLFYSCLHRVGGFPGQTIKERYSFAYFLRAEDTTPMRGVNSPLVPTAAPDFKVFTSEEWLHKKYSMLRGKTWTREEDWVLTGARKYGITA